MKKYLRYADVLVLFAGAVGLLLQLIIHLGGTDEKNLYPHNHPAWVLLCLFSVAVLVFLWALTRQVGVDTSFHKNFPASTLGAVTTALAAVGIAVTALATFNGKLLNTLGGLAGLLSAAGLLLAAWSRFRGQRPHFLCHAMPAAFFALRIFLLGQELGAEPEAVRYLFQMFASMALVLACYQLWGFAVDMGHRDKCLFWTLTSAYLCITAVAAKENWLLYLTCAPWMLTNCCSLKYLPKRMRSATEQPDADITQPTAETEPAVQAFQSADKDSPVSTPVDPVESIDPDTILAEILREIDKNVE